MKKTMKSCPTLLECASDVRRTRSSSCLHVCCVQIMLKSVSPVVLEKQTFALSRDDPPPPAIPKFLLLGFNDPTLCFSTLLGSRAEANGEFSCGVCHFKTHTVLVCTFKLHLICGFFNWSSLLKSCASSEKQGQIPALF